MSHVRCKYCIMVCRRRFYARFTYCFYGSVFAGKLVPSFPKRFMCYCMWHIAARIVTTKSFLTCAMPIHCILEHIRCR